MENNLIYLITKLANKNNIVLDKIEAKVQLLSHPDYPSLSSISGLFNHFKIDYFALKVETNFEVFEQVPKVFLAQIAVNDKGNELVIVSKNKNNVEIIFNKNKSEIESVESFLEKWTGILFVIEKPQVKLSASKSRTKYFKIGIGIITMVILFGTFLYSKPSLFQVVHFGLSLVGIYISYLIVQHELGVHSQILDKFCSGQRKRTNCDAVLNSKGATIFGLFKLSDVGFVYFTSLALTWLVFSFNNFQTTSIFFLISSLAIPFTFISIYYQKVIVKNWCPLCITIVGILWLQFASLFIINSFWESQFIIDSSSIFLLASIVVVVTSWLLIYPLLKKEQKLEKFEIEYIKFKRNFKLFNAALNLNEQLETEIFNYNEIVFGNTNKANILNIMIITNPMCGFCKESHALVEKILEQENPAIQITIRFNVQVANKEAIGTKIAAKILELYHKTDEKDCLIALSDIYGKMDAITWLKKWGEASSLKYLETLKEEKEWCTSNKINFTPAVLINGKQYPTAYDRMDLLYFIDDLLEEQTIVKEELIEVE
ncbi:thioredoxin domain-containing protein [Lutibacter sp. A64]|uniref:vitamin K epoxide reductase family protein n=1 Tax=Lutibacter sp. A64 TaxID=2918526 RepID=UPI001F06F7BC|nr:vitamin K epoxide reductase family protein [Lutibacter sp. A64]UMB53919.1 thioredoxin domain-containing protein [Lutibacter sp. A64]